MIATVHLRPSSGGSPPLSKFIRHYACGRLSLGAASLAQHEIAVRLFARWLGRSATLGDLCEDTLRQFLADYLAEGWSPATVNNKRTHLLALWRFAFEEDLIDRPPQARRIPRARERTPVPEAWDAIEVGRLLAAAGRCYPARRDWWVAVLLVLYDTGARISEVLRLDACDMDLDRGWVVFRRTKTGAERWRRLHADTVAVCRRVVRDGGGPAFPWPYSRRWLDDCFRRICRHAGVRYGRGRGGLWHKLRRSSGTLVEQHEGPGHTHLGNTRRVFERHYQDPRFAPDTLRYLPRPEMP